MSFLILREFDVLYDTCVDQGWEPRENTDDVMRIVSPGDLAEIKVILRHDQIHMSVPIQCEGDPHATQYTTRYDDVEDGAANAARFGEFHIYNYTDGQ
jgi:hypothetical protein